jgi:transposase
MKRTEVLQEIRKMRFEDAYYGWQEGRLSQEEAARILGVCDRSFRRYRDRYEAQGMEGLMDKRLSQASHRRAPVDEVMALQDRYRSEYRGWNVRHFHAWYRREGGTRSYTWVKNRLQEVGLANRAKRKGAHRKRRERAAMPGMMLHQDASQHEWVPGQLWDLIVTMDDATSEQYSMFFVDEESTQSSFRGVEETIAEKGLFCSLYTDRGSHYWNTPAAGGPVDKVNLTQFGRAMKQLGITMIAAYSPEARGRSERMFKTHQGRLPNELAKLGITTMQAANQYLKDSYMSACNAEFSCAPREPATAFVPYM